MLAGMRSKLLWFRVRKFALGVLIALSTPVLAFQHSSESGRAKIHTELSSADWKLRRTGFYRLLQPSNQVRVVERGQLKLPPDLAAQALVRKELINLLALENQNVAHPTQKGPELEEYFNYYGDVIGVVSYLRDAEAIPALAGTIGTGNMATNALARYGELSLPAVISKLRSPDAIVRGAALFTLQKMLELKTLKGAHQKSRLKSIFLNALEDSAPFVRSSAIYALGALDDPSILPVIAKVAQSDPFVLKGEGEGGKDLFPVRYAATRVLQQKGASIQK